MMADGRWENFWSIFLVVTMSVCGGVNGQLMTCPQVCSCIWRNGKQTTICENQNLISIPNQLSPSTQVLDLNNNNFQILPSKAFQERGLINLQKLFLPRCKLGAIAEDAFYWLTNLVELDLSDNLLTHVPMKALANSTNLRRLLLSNNHIATIQAESFASLTSLKFLNLSGCKTHTIESRAFHGLRDLEYLYLQNNQLTMLPYSVVTDLPALYSFELYKNPWQCNCEMRPTREWMIRNNVGQSIPPTCDFPLRLQGLMWNSLDLDDFACEPDIITTTVEVIKSIGSNATLSCIVKGLPEPKVFWYMDNGFYNLSMNPRTDKYHLNEERGEGTVNSILTVINVDLNDDLNSYICSAENRAGTKSKNFTVFVIQSSAFGGIGGNWSKVELAGSILGILITLVMMFVVITLFLIKTKRFPLPVVGGSNKKFPDNDNDSMGKKANHLALLKSAVSNNGQIYPAQPSNGTTKAYVLQHHLSMLGLDGIDKKPEIFFNQTNQSFDTQQFVPNLYQSDLNGGVGNHSNGSSVVPGSHLNRYEMSLYNNNHGFDVNNQEEAIFNNEPTYFHHQRSLVDNDGLYRAVMVPSSVITTTTTATSNPTLNLLASNISNSTLATTTTMTTNSTSSTTNRSSSSPFMPLSASNLYNHYLSQYDLNQLQKSYAMPTQQHRASPVHYFAPPAYLASNESANATLPSYGNPGFISSSNEFLNDADVDSEVFIQTTNGGALNQPLVQLISSADNNAASASTMVFGPVRLSPLSLMYSKQTPINVPYSHPPIQLAPSAQNQQSSSIYGSVSAHHQSTNNANSNQFGGWSGAGSGHNTPMMMMTTNIYPQQLSQQATNFSNIVVTRYSPDEGYGEESSTGQSVGILEGTEV